LSEALGIAGVIGGALEVIGTLFGDHIQAGWSGLKLLVGEKIGWLDAAINEAIGRAETRSKPWYIYILKEEDFRDLYKDYLWLGIRTQGWLGGRFADAIIRDVITGLFSLAVHEVVSDYARLTLNAHRGSRLPWGFDLVWVGEYLEDIDEDFLAFFGAITGSHVFTIVNYIAQALSWGYSIYSREVESALDKAVDKIEDYLLWDIDVYASETRWWYAEALRTYHRAWTRLTAMIDHICERALSRLWELRISVTTTYLWWLDGLVDTDRLLKAWDQVDAEIDMTLDNVDKATELVENVLATINYETELDMLEETMNNFYYNMALFELNRIYAITKYPYNEFMNRLKTAIEKIIAYRQRISKDYTRWWYTIPVEIGYPEKPLGLEIVDIRLGG